MRIIRTDDFEKEFQKLSVSVRRLYGIQEDRFKLNWRDVRLHLKKLQGLNEVFSIRVTRRYRVLFYFQDQGIAIFFMIDHRKDIYRN